MQGYVEETLAKLLPYFGMADAWQVQIINGKCVEEDGTPFRGGAECDPEYSTGQIKIDFERLETGDQVDEIIIHELVHLPLMWLHNQADNLAGLSANLLHADHQTNALGEYAREQVRRAAEKSATDLGHTILRMYRRIQQLELELDRQCGRHSLQAPCL